MSLPTPEQTKDFVCGLARLSSECLGLIIQSCSFYDLMALELAGNKALSSKLEHSVSKIDIEVSLISKWTLLPFRYRQLRSLSIRNRKCRSEGPFLVPNDRLLPAEGHKTLEKLRIRSPLAMTLLHNDATYPALSTLLPNLKKLAIHTDGRFDIEMLRNVPSTVYYFLLHYSALDGSDHSYPLSSINYFPRNLHVLKLNVPLVVGEAGNEPNIFVSFPPALAHLTLTVDDAAMALKVLPNSLTELSLTFTASGEPRINVSLFPKNLTKLKFQTFSCFPTLLVDASFPFSLIALVLPDMATFELPTSNQKLTDITAFLPPSITNLELPSQIAATMKAPHTVTRLRYCLQNGEMPEFAKMRNLKDLIINHLHLDVKSILDLPLTLTRLNAKIDKRPEWKETLIKLTNLTALSLTTGSVSLPLELWEHLSQRLISLHCSISGFDSIKALSALSWPKLKRLLLFASNTDAPPSDFLEAFNAESSTSFTVSNLMRYPQGLEFLTVIGFRYARLLWPPIALLSKVTRVQLDDSLGDPLTSTEDQSLYNFLLTLPPSLTELNFHTPSYVMPKYLWNLPAGLLMLRLQCGYESREVPYSDNLDPAAIEYRQSTLKVKRVSAWTEQHLRHLPPKLQYLSTRGFCMFHPNRFASIQWPSTLLYTSGLCGHEVPMPLKREAERQQKL